MILLDVNLLVYAHNLRDERYDAARSWLEEQLNGGSRVGLPWLTLLGFLRLSTNPRVLSAPLSMRDAWENVSSMLACDNAWTPEATDRHAEVLGGLLAANKISSNLASDAHLAALAIEHGLTLCSTDGDFARFPGLRFENPLVGPREA